MRLVTIAGLIKRRILVNFLAEPDVVRRILPAPLEPMLFRGRAVVGVCLIRLERVAPKPIGGIGGISSENAAHRIAVAWTDARGERREGVYVARRDSDSRANRLAGGRILPGVHGAASFSVRDDGRAIELAMRAADGLTVSLRARAARALPETSAFASVEEASRFFERGADGFSPSRAPGRLDGLKLVTRGWRVEALDVIETRSRWLSDPERFPIGSVVFDHALVMRDVEHEWEELPPLEVAS